MFTHNTQAELLPIVIEGHTFKPNTDGLWSLTEIHQTLNLPESKRPGQWDNEVSNRLLSCGNFHKVDKVGSFADELGTIAYAMWVSTDFFLMVARAFVYPVDNFGSREGSPRPHKQGFAVGSFVKTSSDFGNREGWRVKPRGLDWLRNKTEEINLKVAEDKARKDKAKRVAKRTPAQVSNDFVNEVQQAAYARKKVSNA